ncbi:MAG: hypothetical protein ACHQ49_02180 [Elusimicrobiota bacterium]
MRQELNGIKTELGAHTARLGGIESKLGVHDERLDRLETLARNTAVTVAGHTEALGRIEKQLVKLDELDGLKKSLEVFTAEIIASRHERALMGKSFFDQQSTPTDHELRLTRIELRDKQS